MDLTNLNKNKTQRKKPSLDLSTMIYGKVPPQAKPLEDAVLGVIMIEGHGRFEEAVDILRKPEVFYVDAHQRIFKVMQNLANKSQPIDILTVVEQLRFQEELDLVGGPYYVTKLTNSVVSGANIEAHCRIILQKFISRELIRLCGETLADAYEDSSDPFDVMDDHEKKLLEITLRRGSSNVTTIDTEIVKAVQRIELRRQSDSHITGIPSGFNALDAITHGWQNTDLIILAARPSVGKTAFALNLARNACMNARKPVPTAFFSLEMSSGQLVERMLSSESEMWLEKIATGQGIEDHDMKQLYVRGIQKLSQAPLHIDDTPALNIFELRAKSRKLKRQYDIGLIIIDYLQLMSGENDRGGNREQEISKISRNLKALAKELQLPIIALSQLSREPDKRKDGNRMPQLSDLRESGAIEQDADVVCFMYRPEYYDVASTEMGESTSGETHIKIAKNRNGKLDIIKLTAQLHIQKFVDHMGTINVPSSPANNWRPVSSLPYKNDLDDEPRIYTSSQNNNEPDPF